MTTKGMRRATLKLVCVGCIGLMLTSTQVLAEDQKVQNPAPPASLPSTPSATSTPHLQIDPVKEGQPAPYSGILLDGPTFRLYLLEHVALEEANLRIAARDKLLQDAAAKADRSWWERNGFWVGAAVGFIGSVFVVWEVRQTLISK